MIFDRLSGFFVSIISSSGYGGIFLLMTLESMVLPVPSELVMPFVGFLVADGKISLWIAILVTTIASITGSLISYFVAYIGGKPLIQRFGKYVFLDTGELDWTERWFHKQGSWTIFVSRFIPVIRHLISIPAGLGKMNIWKFITATVVGATLWNTFLLYIGIQLRERWELVHKYSRQLDVLMVLVIVVGIGYYVYRHVRKHRKS
jgi:membrane protein DedA with SNARE-associated domain